ncbi:hypothetical protein, partial [Candidatus Rhabdochlamydia sp. W815]|uniref:hypothetical protein n=1 Tax=Candidatus Rhabdochlamydia sp. W815 TaxID=2720721 RepID=UPI001BFCB939
SVFANFKRPSLFFITFLSIAIFINYHFGSAFTTKASCLSCKSCFSLLFTTKCQFKSCLLQYD